MAENNKNDKVAAAFKKIEDNVQNIFQSDAYKNYLSAMSKFYNYSLNNTILIALQKPDATLVAGFNAWKKNFNRDVNKGEKGIAILAPCPFKKKIITEKKDEWGETVLNPDTGKPEMEEKQVEYLSYRVVYVFDVKQTSGEPIPSLSIDKLQGESDIAKTLFSSVRELASEFDVNISYADKDDPTIKSGANGYYNKLTRSIVVDPTMPLNQQAKTMIHEIAHSVLHSDMSNNLPRDSKEIQAESVAFAVMDHFGLDTSSYSFKYVAIWAQDKTPEELKTVLNAVQKDTQEIISKIEPIFAEKQKEVQAIKQNEENVAVAVGLTEESFFSKSNVNASSVNITQKKNKHKSLER